MAGPVVVVLHNYPLDIIL